MNFKRNSSLGENALVDLFIKVLMKIKKLKEKI